MPGVIAWLSNCPSEFSTSVSRQGVLSCAQVRALNTGRARRSAIEDLEAKLRRSRRIEDTNWFADVLETAGEKARLGVDLSMIASCTCMVDRTQAWRNTNILPAIADRNRAAMLREFEAFWREHPRGRFFRYAVFTYGRREPLFGPLRETIQTSQARLRKLAKWAKDNFGIIFVLRVGELTVDFDLSFHPHANVVYYVDRDRPLSKSDWGRFIDNLRHKWGAIWKDNGRVRSPSEVVKYFAKGDDLSLLAAFGDAAPQWGSGSPDYLGLGEHIAKRMVAREIDEMKKRREIWRRPTVEERLPVALQKVSEIVHRLRAEAASGQSHPFKWLFDSMFKLRLVEAMGDFRTWRKTLKEDGFRLTEVHPEYRIRRVQKDSGKKRKLIDPSECSHVIREAGLTPGPDETIEDAVARYLRVEDALPRDLASGQKPLVVENVVLGVTLPQARHTRFAEPQIMVLGYTDNPRTDAGKLGLERIKSLSSHYLKIWTENGAPSPQEALRETRRAMAEAGGAPACGEASASGNASYSSHYYDNCPEEALVEDPPMLFFASDGSFVDRQTGEVVYEPPQIDLKRFEIDPFDPQNWEEDDPLWEIPGDEEDWHARWLAGGGKDVFFQRYYSPSQDGCSDV